MFHAMVFLLFVVRLRPSEKRTAEVSPKVDGGTEGLVAGPPHLGDRVLTGLLRHRSGSGVSLERFMGVKARAVITEFTEQSGSDLLPRAREGSEAITVGVAVEQLRDAFAILIELCLEGA